MMKEPLSKAHAEVFFDWAAKWIRKARAKDLPIRIWLTTHPGTDVLATVTVEPWCNGNTYKTLPAAKFSEFSDAEKYILGGITIVKFL